MELHGKTAIVTGAGSGIGRELALEFARADANVVCCARTEFSLRETVALIEIQGGVGAVIKTDVSQWEQVQEMVHFTLQKFGRIDVVFNNAGSFQYVGPVWEADPKSWWEDVTINLYGSMLCCRAVLPHMMKQDSGIIINMDGGGGSNGPNPGGTGYGCSKAALLRFSESLALELEAVGSAVLVFCMMPGFVRTHMTEYLISTPEKARWQTHVRELMGSDAELPPGACAMAAIKEQNLYVLHVLTLDGKLGPWPVITN